MKSFDTWEAARAFAESYAKENKQAMGIEAPSLYERQWVVRMLPKRQNRSGWELRCEAVESEEVRHVD